MTQHFKSLQPIPIRNRDSGFIEKPWSVLCCSPRVAELWSFDGMNTSHKSNRVDKLLGLVIVTGFMLIITALPLGLILSLQDHYKFNSDWHWAIILGVAMSAATAIVGAIILCTGEFITQRRKKTKVG